MAEQAAVRLDRVSKTFGNRRVLDRVSLQVAPAEAFCIIGRSGVGKSVTLKLMIGLLKPDGGEILIEGENIGEMDDARISQVRRRMGYLFQGGALFDSISVFENVAFPLRRHTRKSEPEIRKIVGEKLRQVELENEGKKMPAELSGGMRKRAGLARALALDPGILLVDEPSTGLDRITASEIYGLLVRLKENKKTTLIAVTHDVRGTRAFADRYAVLHEGRIAGCGSAEELARSENPMIRELVSIPEEQ